jgi:hypothetical protein
MTEVIVPDSTEKLTWFSALTPPNDKVRLSISSNGEDIKETIGAQHKQHK